MSLIASLDILYCNHLNLKNKITKIEHKKIFCDPSKILGNIWWPINICLKYFMATQKLSGPSSYILNVRSLIKCTIFSGVNSLKLKRYSMMILRYKRWYFTFSSIFEKHGIDKGCLKFSIKRVSFTHRNYKNKQ